MHWATADRSPSIREKGGCNLTKSRDTPPERRRKWTLKKNGEGDRPIRAGGVKMRKRQRTGNGVSLIRKSPNTWPRDRKESEKKVLKETG